MIDIVSIFDISNLKIFFGYMFGIIIFFVLSKEFLAHVLIEVLLELRGLFKKRRKRFY